MTAQILPSTPPGDGLLHAALLYRDAELLRSTVAEFVAEAARDGEPMLAVLPAPNLELLDDVLGGERPTLTVQDMTEVGRNPACLLAVFEDWVAEHPGPSRVIAEPMWPQRSDAEKAECLRHEALLNHAFATAPLNCLCPYDAEHLAGDVIAGAEMTHPHLLDETGPRPSPSFGDPLEMAAGVPWPLLEPAAPVVEHRFGGDLAALRRELAGDPLVAGLDDRRRSDLVFAINEAVTNAIRHGDGEATTRVWRDGDRVVTEITASTWLDDPYAGRRRPAADAVGGRGLWLINQLCDLVELRSGADGLCMRLHVEARG
jgi:anti-sigma regulatory factor (Ser/Thr protein kinase)